MLTSDLLRVRRSGELLVPRYLSGKLRGRLAPVAAELVAVLQQLVGRPRDEIVSALDAVACRPTDRAIMQGLRKLMLDRCEFELPADCDPAPLRERLFKLAAARRKALGARESFDRAAIVDELCAEQAVDCAELERLLFADLKGNERLTKLLRVTPDALLDRYDVALAQGVLLRATSVQVALDGESPGRLRQLFRAARFHGLLHRVSDAGEGRYLVELDGPLSLFSAVKRYGIKLALFLPAVLRCKRWLLRADVLWGKRREQLRFELGPRQGLVPHDRKITGVSPEVERFVAGFRKLDSAWSVETNEQIIALPDEAVCIPDLLFSNEQTGEQVYLEAFGFWSRKAVWQRVETIARGFPGRILLAVGKHLRVSEEVLDQDAPGQLYIYKQSMRPRAVLALLDDEA